MSNKVYIAASLDGFIAEPDGGLDWLTALPNPDGSDFGFSDFMNGIDALVMGRNTFEKVLEFDEWIYDKPVFVLSNCRKDIPEKLLHKAALMNGDVVDVVEELNSRGYKDLYIDGGNVIQEFLKRDLIDEMILTFVSVILGKGIPLFGRVGVSRSFALVKTEKLNEHLVKQTYTRASN